MANRRGYFDRTGWVIVFSAGLSAEYPKEIYIFAENYHAISMTTSHPYLEMQCDLYFITLSTHASPYGLLLPTPLLPIHPTSRVLPHLLPPRLSRQLRRSPTPHPGFTIKHHLLLLSRPLEPHPILKLLRTYEERIGFCCDGDVDRARDCAGCLEL